MSSVFFGKGSVAPILLCLIVIVLIICLCTAQFNRYTPPSNDNTSIISVTVSDVYYSLNKKSVVIRTSNGDEYQLVSPTSSNEMYDEIGYNLEELGVLIKEKKVELLVLDELPWVVEINVDGVVISNCILTTKYANVTQVSIIILGVLMAMFPISLTLIYSKKA